MKSRIYTGCEHRSEPLASWDAGLVAWHTVARLLKNVGVSDVIARDIIGHESEAISRNYTYIESETKRRAFNKMPDVTRLSEQLTLGF